jgi:hypothetical protein
MGEMVIKAPPLPRSSWRAACLELVSSPFGLTRERWPSGWANVVQSPGCLWPEVQCSRTEECIPGRSSSSSSTSHTPFAVLLGMVGIGPPPPHPTPRSKSKSCRRPHDLSHQAPAAVVVVEGGRGDTGTMRGALLPSPLDGALYGNACYCALPAAAATHKLREMLSFSLSHPPPPLSLSLSCFLFRSSYPINPCMPHILQPLQSS